MQYIVQQISRFGEIELVDALRHNTFDLVNNNYSWDALSYGDGLIPTTK